MREAVKDRTRLMHILEAISNIMEFKEGVSYEDFAENKLLKFGIFTMLPSSVRPHIN